MQQEIWKTYPEDKRYQVSTLGNVKTIKTGLMRKPVQTKNGYMTLAFSSPRKLRYVHTMVLETFSGKRIIGMTASHITNNKKDNRIHNLMWESHRLNIKKKKIHGTEPVGEKRWSSKLTEIQATFAKYSELSESKAAKIVGVSRGQVNRIRSGRNWAHI